MNWFIRYLPLFLIALAWELAPRVGVVSPLALPPLSDVLRAFVDLLQSGDLLANALPSLYRGSFGLALAVVVGGALGLAMAWWRPASRMADSVGVFAGLVEIAVAGFVLIKAMAALRRRLLRWHQEAQEPAMI